MTDPAQLPIDDFDERILSEISQIHDVVDPAPPSLTNDVILRIFTDTLDAELATLQRQSEPALRTSNSISSQTVTFTSSHLQLMISANDSDADTRRIDGWITGGGIMVDLVYANGNITATSDAHGRLVWRDIPKCPIRFLIRPLDDVERPVLTPFVEF